MRTWPLPMQEKYTVTLVPLLPIYTGGMEHGHSHSGDGEGDDGNEVDLVMVITRMMMMTWSNMIMR